MKKVLAFTALFFSSLVWAESTPYGTPPALSTLPHEIIAQVTNAPNPFDSRRGGIDGETRISYWLASNYSVQVTLYDLLGSRVCRWTFQPGQEGGRSGVNSVRWDGVNEAGQKVAKGGYIAQIEVEAGTTVATVFRKIGVLH
ncbi:MAG: FlgD immunoglobulin-like domain containing protein [Elusimicrobiota bacterium]|jgi:hypothetical protein